jgi:hypothetical protein
VTIAISWGGLPRAGLLLTADCAICGYTFRAVLPDQQTAERCGVDHRCGTGVVGPLWTLVQPPNAPARRVRRSVENAA